MKRSFALLVTGLTLSVQALAETGTVTTLLSTYPAANMQLPFADTTSSCRYMGSLESALSDTVWFAHVTRKVCPAPQGSTVQTVDLLVPVGHLNGQLQAGQKFPLINAEQYAADVLQATMTPKEREDALYEGFQISVEFAMEVCDNYVQGRLTGSKPQNANLERACSGQTL